MSERIRIQVHPKRWRNEAGASAAMLDGATDVAGWRRTPSAHRPPPHERSNQRPTGDPHRFGGLDASDQVRRLEQLNPFAPAWAERTWFGLLGKPTPGKTHAAAGVINESLGNLGQAGRVSTAWFAAPWRPAEARDYPRYKRPEEYSLTRKRSMGADLLVVHDLEHAAAMASVREVCFGPADYGYQKKLPAVTTANVRATAEEWSPPHWILALSSWGCPPPARSTWRGIQATGNAMDRRDLMRQISEDLLRSWRERTEMFRRYGRATAAPRGARQLSRTSDHRGGGAS